MKKILSAMLSLILLSISSFAAENTSQSWYFASKNQNDRPTLPVVNDPSVKGIGADEKVIYLTFDAGYENGNVEKTVDILKEHEVPGAFFVLRHFVEKNPELCKKMKENGNLVCNHTSSHPCITKISEDDLKREIEELENVYRDLTGYEMDRYFRPPEGTYSEEALRRVSNLGYRTVFWSLAWADWDNNNQKTPEYAMGKIMPRIHNGTILLLHPTSDTNTKILGEMISSLKEKGFRFASLEELW